MQLAVAGNIQRHFINNWNDNMANGWINNLVDAIEQINLASEETVIAQSV